MKNLDINHKEKIFSLHLNSNNPNNFERFCKSFIENAENPYSIEIIVHIDLNDELMKKKIDKINSSYNVIRYIETSLIKNFNDAWKPINLLLKQTSRSVKIVTCLSDDIIMISNDWDKIIYNHFNKFDDQIFRIRCSQYKNETYSNIWECGFKPDFSFYSKKWLDIVGYWNPCVGPDTFQETVSYYLNLHGKKFHRSIIDKKLIFKGEETLTGLNLRQRIKRAKLGYKSFSDLISYKNQEKAKFAAYKLANEIDNNGCHYEKLNFFKHTMQNLYKKLYFFHYRGTKSLLTSSFIFNITFIIWCKINILDNSLIKFIIYLEKKKFLKKIITNKVQYKKLKEAIRNSEYSS